MRGVNVKPKAIVLPAILFALVIFHSLAHAQNPKVRISISSRQSGAAAICGFARHIGAGAVGHHRRGRVTALSPPHDLMAQQMGGRVLAGPAEIGMPASGMITSDPFAQGKTAARETGATRNSQDQSFHRGQPPGNHPRAIAVGKAKSRDRRAFL
jgi:hypothetical protein